MKILFVGDPRSVHTVRWVSWFGKDHEVALMRVFPADVLSEVPGPTLPQGGGLGRLRLVRSVFALRRFIRRFAPDLVHAHYTNESGWLVAFSGTHPWVLSVWGSDVYRAPQESRLARLLNPWAVRRADAVFADSAHQLETLRSWGMRAEKGHRIGWGVDCQQFHPAVSGQPWRGAMDIPGDALVVFSPRQWVANSHIPAIVRAHAHLGEEVYLVLKRLPAFESREAAEVWEEIARSPARDRIRVVDEVDEAKLPELYAVADVVVSLAETDGTPVSVLEAMALGKPVVAYAAPSLREWIRPQGGRLVNSHQAMEIAAALQFFLEDFGRRTLAGAHNRKLVEAEADRSKEMARAETVYRALTSKPRPV